MAGLTRDLHPSHVCGPNVLVGRQFRGWVLYDGRCGLCQSGARLLGGVARSRGFRLAQLQRAWVRRRLSMSEERLLSRTWVLTPEGQLFGGAAAYVHVSAVVWWASPLVVISRLPGGMRLLDWVYRNVAAHRYRISGACRLDPVRRRRSRLGGRYLTRIWDL